MNTFHFLETNWEIIFDIACSISIMRQFHMIMKPVFLFWNAQAEVPLHSFFFPELVPLFLRTRPDKKLHFHLLEFTHPENKLPGNNFISECFAYLCNTKRNFKATGFL